MNRNGKLDMKFQNLVSSIPKHLLLVSSINVPNFTSDSGNGEDVQNSNLESYLSSVKSDLAKHVPSDKYSTNSLPNKVVPVMYQLICLLLEDFKLSKGNFANGLIYLEDIIGTIEHIIKESKPYHQVVDMVARCKYKLAARKRNLQNNVEEEDYELKMNFLNRSVDLDMGLTALKELLMMKTIWQHYNMRSRLREGGSQLAEYLIQDFSDSEIMSPLDSRSRSISHKSSDAINNHSDDVDTSDESEIVINNNTSAKNLNIIVANQVSSNNTRDVTKEDE